MKDGGTHAATAVAPELHPLCDSDALRMLVDSSADGLALLSADGRILHVNEAAAQLLETSREELLGRRLSDVRLRLEATFVLQAWSTRVGVSRTQDLGNGRKVLVTIRPARGVGNDREHLILLVRDVTAINELVGRVQAGNAPKPARWHDMRRGAAGENDLITESRVMQNVARTAAEFARMDSPVLITGETGTGKSLLARVIHQTSGRANGPFRELNCGAIPADLMESELFGYAAGAFTGADARGKTGLIELSNAGTLLLDEIGDLPLLLQVKLLQFVEAGEVWPVGARRPRRVNVRIIAATNADLSSLIQEKLFRRDLFYRLNVLVLQVPPLREHPEDIPPLIERMLALLEGRVRRRVTFAKAALDLLAGYPFPGNVRELWNLVERLAVSSSSGLVDVPDLPGDVVRAAMARAVPEQTTNLRDFVRKVEAAIVREAVDRYGSQTKAARQLGIAQATVARKARRPGTPAPAF